MFSSKKPFRLASFDVLPDNKRIVFCGRGDQVDSASLYTFHIKTRKVERLTNGPDTDLYPAVSPDGKQVLFSSAASGAKTPGSLYCQDLNGTVRKRLTATTLSDGSPSFAPDKRRIVFARAARNRDYSFGGYVWDQWDLFTARPDGGDERQVTKEKYRDLNSPSGFRGRTPWCSERTTLARTKNKLSTQ